jgi:hypothetical protein
MGSIPGKDVSAKNLLHFFAVAEKYGESVAPHGSRAERKEAAWYHLKGRLYADLGCPEGFLD